MPHTNLKNRSKTASDFGFADSGTAQFADLIGLDGGGNRSAQTFAVLSRMGEPGANSLAQNFALELRKHSQQCSHGVAGHSPESEKPRDSSAFSAR